MRLKFALVLAVFILIFASLIGVVSAADCSSNPDDRIMKLFNATNSHGALYDYPDYNWDICCSDIFGGGNSACNPSTTHPATCSNPIVWLYQNNNSHASVNNLTGYNISVCYGDLTCRNVIDPTGCASDEKIVVRLYQENNSHISNASDTNYTIKICCKSGAPVGDVYWADMNGNPITNAEIGDTVLMIYNSSGSYSYEILEDDLIENNSWFDDEIRTITNSFILNGKVAAKWTITQTDYEKGNSAEDMEFFANNHEEFYFNVNGVTSGDLIVNQSSYDNSVPYTNIINPLNGADYIINESTGKTGNISFEQISNDTDDDLKILWSFGDGTESTWLENCLTTGNCNTNHFYSNSGYKVIKLSAREMERIVPQTAVDYSGIYIYKKGTNVFAIITQPEFGKPFSGRFIQVYANDSFAAECNSICPNSTAPSCGACYNVTDSLGVNPDLTCCNYTKDDRLLFNWTFDDGTSRYGDWLNNYTDVVNFTKFFAEAGEHEINLRVGYNKTS